MTGLAFIARTGRIKARARRNFISRLIDQGKARAKYGNCKDEQVEQDDPNFICFPLFTLRYISALFRHFRGAFFDKYLEIAQPSLWGVAKCFAGGEQRPRIELCHKFF